MVWAIMLIVDNGCHYWLFHKKSNHSGNSNVDKAGSIHDLRRCAVSNLLKVPPQYTTFESTQRMPLNLQIKTDQKRSKSNIAEDANDDVMVIQTDMIRESNDSGKLVLVNGILPSKSPLRAKLAHWTKCLWTNPKTLDNPSDGDAEQLPLEELGRHRLDRTQKRVSF